ncbi:MAG: MotA/TolQ/ExbB proton channel family protein [Planctomycetaceae bacterium]|nr:MAG: MotA/TolQ/ExbB proton channel family protein [Planctomycetaceae bacterium]
MQFRRLLCPAPLGLWIRYLAIGVCLLASGLTSVHAQDELDEFADPAPAVAAPADPPADQPEAAADPAAAAAPPATPGAPTSLLGWTLKSLGLPYAFIFLALSITLVSLFVMNLLAARRDTLVPQELIDGFEEKLNEKKFQDAYDLARADESVLGQVLSAGLAKLSKGYQKALEGMQEVGEEESMKLEHRLSYMALIGNLSPMVGLFGTVQGMIASFQVIALAGASPKPAELAEGISTALFTTLVGLAVAIPAIAAYNILRNRVARLLLEVGVTSENLMSRFDNDQSPAAKR